MININIPDIITYNNNMRNSLSDKLYFTNLINSDVYIDFGCGDGSLLKRLAILYPNKSLIGYDISNDMLSLARKQLKEFSNVTLYDNINNIINNNLENCTLILSSVIHEIYSYGNTDSIKNFWNIVFNNKFKYIVIRDLMIKSSIKKYSSKNDINKIYQYGNLKQLRLFEENWGSISYYKNLIHFLMKYKWKENYNREVKENYFPIYTEEFLSYIPNYYTIEYFNEFIPIQTQQGILNDFDIVLNDTTHIKCILKRQ